MTELTRTTNPAVLVASSNRALVRHLSQLLGGIQYVVRQATTPQQARNLLAAEPIDMMIVDGDEWDEDVLELCREASAREHSRYVYVLLLVAPDGRTPVAEALQAGVDDVLTKPLSHGELLARLRAAVRGVEFERRAREQDSNDWLTGLPGRVELHSRLARLLTDTRTATAACALVDIDFLAHVNHARGFPAGDQLLRAAAALLREQCDAPRMLLAAVAPGRYCAVMPDKTAADAAAWAEQVRALVAETEFEAGGTAVQVTVSVGVAAGEPGMSTAEAVLEQAAAALRFAKLAGRDCVIRHDEMAAGGPNSTRLGSPGKLLEGTAASDVMIPCTVTLRGDQTPDAAQSLIERTGLGALAVVDESGGLQGIVTAERLASTAQDKPHARLADIIDRNVEVFDETTTFATLTGFFVANPSAVAVVVGDGKPLGFLTAAGIVDLAAPPEPCPANRPSWESHYLMLPDPAFASTDVDWDEVPLSFSQHRG